MTQKPGEYTSVFNQDILAMWQKVRSHIDENEIDRSFIKIRDLKFINGQHTFEEITYEIEKLTEIMNKLRIINLKLLNLWEDILEDYKLNNSHLL